MAVPTVAKASTVVPTARAMKSMPCQSPGGASAGGKAHEATNPAVNATTEPAANSAANCEGWRRNGGVSCSEGS